MEFKIPMNLSHKPVIKVEKYEKFDGEHGNNSDAKGLSLGFAQYDDKQISAKVWRHSGIKWSRQSEELPLNRVLDLTLLILKTKFSFEKDKGNENLYIFSERKKLKINFENTENFKNIFQKYDKMYLTERILEIKKIIEEIDNLNKCNKDKE